MDIIGDLLGLVAGLGGYTGAFMSFGLLAFLPFAFARWRHRDAWLDLEPGLPAESPREHLPFRSESDAPPIEYMQTRRGISGRARATAIGLYALGFLAIPGTLLGLYGLLLLGAGLTAIPVVIVALRAGHFGGLLMRADPRFVDCAPSLARDLRWAAAWAFFVVTVVTLIVPFALALIFPVLGVVAFMLALAKQVPIAAYELEANLRRRGY